MGDARWLGIMAESFPPFLAAGLLYTIPLSLLSFALGSALGFATAIARLYGGKALASAAGFYVWIVRGTPLLVQLFLIFYGLPNLGIVLDAFPAALIGFTVSVGAYTSEIMRAAIGSVPAGQWEAAYSVGMSWRQALSRTVLPQAARFALPPLGNSFISLVKDTSLAAAITVPELFQSAQRVAAVTYEPLVLYTEAALIYLGFSSILSYLQRKLESRLGRHVGTPGRQP